MVENIFISDRLVFENKKKKIITGGFNELFVVSDFDRTMTHAFLENGESVPSLISILRSNDEYISRDYSKKTQKLFDKYHPIEIDNSKSVEERKDYMNMWWREHFELLIQSRLNRNVFEKLSCSNRIRFRGGLESSIEFLCKHTVPFVVISANGLGDESLGVVMEHNGLLYDNVYIVSNRFEWNNDGYMISYKLPFIHSFNKNEQVISQFPFYNLVSDKKNVILLGDGLGDVQMVSEKDYDTVLKIGFLNYDIEKNLDAYSKVYDVIITNDSDMIFFYDLLREFNNK